MVKFLTIMRCVKPRWSTEHFAPNPIKKSSFIEKYILRDVFDTPESPYLPDEILWRQKEQFFDGVGYNWIDALIVHCESQVTDQQPADAPARFPYNTPLTKEAYYYRDIFYKYYPQVSAAQTVRKWIPK